MTPSYINRIVEGRKSCLGVFRYWMRCDLDLFEGHRWDHRFKKRLAYRCRRIEKRSKRSNWLLVRYGLKFSATDASQQRPCASARVQIEALDFANTSENDDVSKSGGFFHEAYLSGYRLEFAVTKW